MVNNPTFSWELFQQMPVIAILRGLPLKTIRTVVPILQETGFSTLEITMNTEGATAMIAALKKEFPGLNIGAGTVCTSADLHEAISAGAQFIVTPILDEAVIKWCVEHKVPVFPGAFTPTEIYKAWSWGAAAVKVFPATQLGPQYIKDVSAPLNRIRLLPTGGVSLENIKAFFEAGAFGVGMGSSLLDKERIQNGNFESLRNQFIKVKSKIREYMDYADYKKS